MVVACVLAAVAVAVRAIDVPGAISGALLGSGIWAAFGAAGFAILALFVVGGSALTRLGYRLKAERGAAEGRRGRRGARNVWANGAVGLVCAGFAVVDPSPIWTAAMVGAFATAFADTAESEIGPLVGGRTISPMSGQVVPPGTEGAVSFAGTLAGIGAALATTVLATVLGLIALPAVVPVALLAVCATLIESLVGSRWTISNERLNLLCTACGAILALISEAGRLAFG